MNTTCAALQDDVLEHIFACGLLDYTDILSSAVVCKQWCFASNADMIWNRLIEQPWTYALPQKTVKMALDIQKQQGQQPGALQAPLADSSPEFHQEAYFFLVGSASACIAPCTLTRSKKLYFDLIKLENRLLKNRRVQRWSNLEVQQHRERSSVARNNGVYPVRTLTWRAGVVRLVDIEFISRKHILGHVAYLIPLFVFKSLPSPR